jgi:hypothetical protein
MAHKADEPSPDQDEAIDVDIRASLAALREDVSRLGEDIVRLAQSQRNATRGAVLDFENELQNRIKANPLSAAMMLIFFGYVAGRLHRRRPH